MRLKSVSNIAKITKSMKMIASTKMAKAQRLMDVARVYNKSSTGKFEIFKKISLKNINLLSFSFTNS